MREVNHATIDLIKKFEGCRLKVYKDVAGYATVGIGHLIEAGESFYEITMQEAEELLQKDLKTAIKGVLRYISVPLSDNQFGALVSFAFNLGNGALQRSTLRQRVNRGDFDIENEFLKYNKAGGKIWKGLTRRRQAESNLFMS